MRIGFIFIMPLLLLIAAVGCREEGPVTILFTGDDHGWIVPAG